MRTITNTKVGEQTSTWTDTRSHPIEHATKWYYCVDMLTDQENYELSAISSARTSTMILCFGPALRAFHLLVLNLELDIFRHSFPFILLLPHIHPSHTQTQEHRST
jgi:hypothetical protein